MIDVCSNAEASARLAPARTLQIETETFKKRNMGELLRSIVLRLRGASLTGGAALASLIYLFFVGPA